MLLQEIDLLDIVQQLRTYKLISNVLLTNNQKQLIRFLNKYSINSRHKKENLKEYWSNPKKALTEFSSEKNEFDSKIYDLMIDSRRSSLAKNLGTFEVAEPDLSDDDNGLTEFGKYKNVPNIEKLIEFWTKEVELESFRESESNL